MSKTWYPVLDYSLCSNCKTCFNKCKHGVYKLIDKYPHVVYPDGCIQNCHGCGNICPSGAITYFSEKTDWTPTIK